MNFEWFDPATGTPLVTIGEYGLGFNKAAIHALGNPAKVRLGYSKENKIIAVCPADESESKAFEFASRERNGYIRVNTKDFVRFVVSYNSEIALNRAVKCLAYWDNEIGCLLVDLKQVQEQPKSSERDEDV